MIVMIGIRIALWNHKASSPIGVTCGWKPQYSVGWPMPGVGAADATEATAPFRSGTTGSTSAGDICSGWAGAAWELALIASTGGAACDAAAGAAAGAGCWAGAAAGTMPNAAATAKILSRVFI